MNESLYIAQLPIFIEVAELLNNKFDNHNKISGLTSEHISLFSRVNTFLPQDMQFIITISNRHVEIPQKTLILARIISQHASEISDLLEPLIGTPATKFY